MENNLVGFKKYNGKKSDLLNITVEPGDIIFGIDSETNLPYIYHDGEFYSDASEWSEALPEIHIGKRMPPEKDPYIKLWLDSNANPPTLKYKNSVTNDWENVSSNIDITETNEIFIGDNLPADISDNVKVWYQTNVDIPDSPTEEVSWGDIKNKPEFAKVATSGSYTDLKDVPDAIKKTYYAHGQVDRSKYTLTDEQLIDNINTQKSIENKENANYIIHVVDTDKYYPVNKVSQEASYVKTLYAVVFEDDDNNIGNDTVNPIVTSVKLNIHNGEILGGIPSGGSGDAFVDSAYLSTKGYVNSHTTTYIGKDSPSTISSKYNLWVDTSKEEVVFKYKAGNEWKVLSTGGSSSIEVDTELSATSENPIANKVVYELATVIGEDFEAISKDLLKKASTENGLVEGRGFKVNDNLKYYLPNTTVTTDPTVDDTHIIATKADTLSNEVIDSKATVYNLYAMDGLTPEQVAANEAALVSVQNREIAIYKVYTSDDTYAIADVKLVPGPYLEAYVYVSNPDTTSEQVTVTKYTYTFNQAGEYTTIDKQEVVVPSLSKVEEMVGTSGGSNGLEIRILSDDTPEENLRTIELVKEGKALAGLADELGVSILTYLGDRKFSQTTYIEDWQVNIAGCIELGENGNLISQAGYVLTGDLTIVSAVDFKFWLRWQTLLSQTTNGRNIRTLYVVEETQICLVDSISTGTTTTEFQYNYNDKRYKRVYTNETGEYTKEEIVVNSGGGGGENNSNSKKIYNIYCELSEDEVEKAKQLESNITAYNACMSNEDALYTIYIGDGASAITSIGIPFEEDALFVGNLTFGTDILGGVYAFELTLHAEGTLDIKMYDYALSASNAIVYFLNTTTTEKTIEGVSKIIECISAGQGVTVVWYRGKDYITTCSDVSIFSSTSIALAIQESGAYATYIINNTGEITQFLKVGTLLLNHSTVENEKNKEVIGPLSILFSSYGGLTGGLSLSILHKQNYYQVLHTKKVDDSYKMKVILDDNSFGTYTLQSNGILTLDS